ncbi:nucleoside-diphosphate kinase [Candidatus Micrarchaeota archaeon]|nr:nucleoside-diphosphate kinase [Candidatus Micrarchaeota archaeon]
MKERTLVFLKPEAIQRLVCGEIIARFEKKCLKIVGMKMMQITKEIAREHYAHIVSKPFYPDLESFITSSPVLVMVLEGKEAVELVLNMCGPTNATKAPPGTIRGDLSNSVSKNIIHRSDTKEAAEKEIKRFFKKEELFDYKMNNQKYFYADDE